MPGVEVSRVHVARQTVGRSRQHDAVDVLVKPLVEKNLTHQRPPAVSEKHNRDVGVVRCDQLTKFGEVVNRGA